jgi:hypothetical protein
MRPTCATLVLVAALAAAPASLVAQSPTPSTIDACYVPASGTIYRIKAPNAPAACLSPTHAPFTWNQQGPKGDKGDTGAAATLNYQRTLTSTRLGPSSYLAKAAICPVGTKIVAAGMDVTGVSGNDFTKLHVLESYPIADREWRFGILNALTREVEITLRAVCL